MAYDWQVPCELCRNYVRYGSRIVMVHPRNRHHHIAVCESCAEAEARENEKSTDPDFNKYSTAYVKSEEENNEYRDRPKSERDREIEAKYPAQTSRDKNTINSPLWFRDGCK